MLIMRNMRKARMTKTITPNQAKFITYNSAEVAQHMSLMTQYFWFIIQTETLQNIFIKEIQSQLPLFQGYPKESSSPTV